MKDRIYEYFDYVVTKGINPKPNQPVEIITSSYINNYLEILLNVLHDHGIGEIIISYIDGKEIEEEINFSWNDYLDRMIHMYNKLINNNFARITLSSPFTIPLTRTDEVDKYKANSYKLSFVLDYFLSLKSQHTIASVPNSNWARRLDMTEEELFDEILNMSYKTSKLETILDKLNELNIKKLYFETGLGTKLAVGLTNNFSFIGKRWKTLDKVMFEPNIPSLEIFTAPSKYEVTGRLVSSKPLYYKGNKINNYYIDFIDGRAIPSNEIEKLLSIDEGLYFAGEIALCLNIDKKIYQSILLDENTGSHLALGNAYLYGIEEIDKINKSLYHIDLVFGTDDLLCKAFTENDEEIIIIKDGKLVYGI